MQIPDRLKNESIAAKLYISKIHTENYKLRRNNERYLLINSFLSVSVLIIVLTMFFLLPWCSSMRKDLTIVKSQLNTIQHSITSEPIDMTKRHTLKDAKKKLETGGKK